MDGARFFNAVVASGTAPRDFAAHTDSLWIDLSKGLGAPVGAVLAGSREFIEHAWVFKQRFGGAMRQAGIIAAAGVFALRHNIERLTEDHDRAHVLASGLREIRGITLKSDRVETNIVIFDVRGTGLSGEELAARTLESHQVRFSVLGSTTLRAVTHLDLPSNAVDKALDAVRTAIGA
jgi:threonine aldolase